MYPLWFGCGTVVFVVVNSSGCICCGLVVVQLFTLYKVTVSVLLFESHSREFCK